MAIFMIKGEQKISGDIICQGSKNSALPILAASYLVGGKTEIHNCPELSDVDATLKILKHLGCEVIRENGTVFIDSSNAEGYDIPDGLMHEMRSSIIFLGAILGRSRRARLSTPGGCEIGLRPINLHLAAMRQFGVDIVEEYGNLNCSCPNGLKGTRLALSFPSVGATENILLAASTAQGTTIVENAAREPEVSDLAAYLNACGARISGCNSGKITIEGVDRLHGTSHTVIPDRIVCATYLCAAAVTGGSVTVKQAEPAHLATVLPVLEEMGCTLIANGNELSLSAPERLSRFEKISTQPYPGFPTDLQALFSMLACTATGTSVVVENIFECRYKHIPELIKMGARVKTQEKVAVFEGVNRLYGANVVSPDLRGGCALVLAGLRAHGETRISDVHHIDRGYEALEKALGALGAEVIRAK